MKIKVLKNFSCNGVRKKPGQYLSEKDIEVIGEKLGNKLLHDDFLLVTEERKAPKKEEPKKEAKKEKKDKK